MAGVTLEDWLNQLNKDTVEYHSHHQSCAINANQSGDKCTVVEGGTAAWYAFDNTVTNQLVSSACIDIYMWLNRNFLQPTLFKEDFSEPFFASYCDNNSLFGKRDMQFGIGGFSSGNSWTLYDSCKLTFLTFHRFTGPYAQ